MLEQSISVSGWFQTRDGLVAQLLGEALALLDHDQATARRRIEHAFALSKRHDKPELTHKQAMIADWQMRRAVKYIEDNLGARLRIDAVAKQIDLSAGYFSRAFKATMGASYSDFIAQARLGLAKRLLLTTDLPIAEIALMCGLSDQSHLTRVFNRSVGLPPHAWRRQLVRAVREREGRDVGVCVQTVPANVNQS